MGMPNDHLKFFRIRIDEDIIEKINRETQIKDGMKQDLISDAADWFATQRSKGEFPPRYFASPTCAEYEPIWVRKETAKRIQDLAKTDGTNASRVLYTALARYVEKK
ncbi:hypothetical protein [Yersinia ruckeri]|uniref:hypothetical protein n=1 Tax=Yersinia ruckeri TaxID=29486 RepID=UPI0005389384|nr:hypothetical protein [Yersinia ruckeri]AUQ43820.1 hypothetical protein NJ56_17770 [Yersinia ruckeri]